MFPFLVDHAFISYSRDFKKLVVFQGCSYGHTSSQVLDGKGGPCVSLPLNSCWLASTLFVEEYVNFAFSF